jgi:hypothetical protein
MKTASVCFGLGFWIAATLGAATATAAPSKALYFDGIDDYIRVPDSSSLDVTSFITTEAWINFSSYPNCCWNVVLSKSFSHQSGNTAYHIGFSNHATDPASSDKLLMEFGSDGGGGTLFPWDDANRGFFVNASPIRNNAWHHIAFVYDSLATQTRLYFDGSLVAVGNASGPIRTNNFDVTIGTHLGHDPRFFRGFIDEVRIWNVARTSAQIAEAMNRDLTGAEPGLVGYWNFSEGGGTTAYDLSGNGNHGTIYGQPLWVTSGPDLQPATVSVPGTLALLALPLLFAAARLRPAA